MDWSKLPDLAAVTLLALAFAAVARRSQASVSTLWLTGWVMIALHFTAYMFVSAGGISGTIAAFFGLAALTWAGTLFMWASVPYRKKISSFWMLVALLATNTLYIAIALVDPTPFWALTVVAVLFGAVPLAIALLNLRGHNHPLRWTLVGLYCGLSTFLLFIQRRPGNGMNLALNAPAIGTVLPNLHLESEVWNLPKYVVAVGMILLLLEEQIEHNKYLALHDELTGLPNRRLFQDRLSSSLERARRTGSNTALLLVDLDQFKQVNDTLGHHVGDQLLKRVGTVFSDRVRRSDTVARTGGDEFSVILDDPISREDAERVGRSLIEMLGEPFEIGNQTLRIGASIGIALFPEDAADGEGLCIAADLRMYDFKHRSGHLGDLPRPPMSVTPSRKDDASRSKQAG